MQTGVTVRAIEVLKAGLLDTVQDLGRPGQAAMALSRGGAMDRDAMTLANALVGNPACAAGLEITGPGPSLRFHCDAWIASVGADHQLTMSQEAATPTSAQIATQRPVFVAAGSVLRWQAPRVGWRSWIAVAGGLNVPLVLGSRSAHLASGIGPPRIAAGRWLALTDDADTLAGERARCVLGARIDSQGGSPAGAQAVEPQRNWPRWQVAGNLPRSWPLIELPVLAGRHLDALTDAARDALFNQVWTVSAQSNRQGLRLQGDALSTAGLPQLASEPVSFGTVQLPPGGEPVILLAEHQTTGGYPRVLEVASAAEPLLAQAGSGSRVRFQLIDLDEADRLALRQTRLLRQRLNGIGQACAYPTT